MQACVDALHMRSARFGRRRPWNDAHETPLTAQALHTSTLALRVQAPSVSVNLKLKNNHQQKKLKNKLIISSRSQLSSLATRT